MKTKLFSIFIALILFSAAANAEETFTGNVFSYGTRGYTGLRTAFFTLTLRTQTPNDKAMGLLEILKSQGQSGLIDAIRKDELGRFSLNSGLGQTINAAVERNVGGQRKIYAIFERWTEFAEVRGGRRSLDYPFGYIELTIDPRTGKGSGQYFAAAKIRWKTDKKTGEPTVEIEDYATYPAKLVNVESKAGRP